MFDPEKSTEEIVLEIAVTTLVFAALLFLLGLKAEAKTVPASEPADAIGAPDEAAAKVLVMPKR